MSVEPNLRNIRLKSGFHEMASFSENMNVSVPMFLGAFFCAAPFITCLAAVGKISLTVLNTRVLAILTPRHQVLHISPLENHNASIKNRTGNESLESVVIGQNISSVNRIQFHILLPERDATGALSLGDQASARALGSSFGT